MEVVIFDGKEYVKASVLAKKFRYTADYLGQLCRGKKVDARLVGRAWYINLESLNDHRDGRYKSTTVKVIETSPATTIIPTQRPRSNYLSRIDVEPILKRKTVAILKSKHGIVTEFPVKYETDEYSLIPRVNKAAVFKSVVIEQVDAEKIKVHKEESAITNFKAEALPEVFLRGTLKVAGLEEATESLLEESEKIDLETKPGRLPTQMNEEKKASVVSVRLLKRRSNVEVARHPQRVSDKTARDTGVPTTIPIVIEKTTHRPELKPVLIKTTPEFASKALIIAKPASHVVAQHTPRLVHTAPITVRMASIASNQSLPRTTASFKPESVVSKEARRKAKKSTSKPVGWWAPLTVLFLACTLAAFVLSSTLEIVVTKQVYRSHVVSSPQTFFAYLEALKKY